MLVVFGLTHEHQRSDRDTFMVYRPENIIGYTRAFKTAIADGVPEHEARRKLTEDSAFCLKYNFLGDAYISQSHSCCHNLAYTFIC